MKEIGRIKLHGESTTIVYFYPPAVEICERGDNKAIIAWNYSDSQKYTHAFCLQCEIQSWDNYNKEGRDEGLEEIRKIIQKLISDHPEIGLEI